MTIKKFSLYSLLLVSITGVFTSCTKNFSELNENPNQAEIAAPETLLAPALYDVLSTNLVRCQRINNDLVQVSIFETDSREFHRYVIRPAESDAMWNGWYLELTNFRDMYKSAAAINQKSYMGIALIMDAWVSSMITDMFGDVPYFQSNMGKENVYTPQFDKQKDIYADLYRKLDSANTLLAANVALTDQQKSLDILYQGDITKWRKLGNSLYLRLLMRLSNKPEMQTAAKMTDILVTNKANYPVFASNADAGILKYTGVSPLFSPFYTYRAIDFQSACTQFFINNLKTLGDPRLTIWATKYNNDYSGIQSGYDVSQSVTAQSLLPDALKTNALLGNIMNYAELQFTIAEAVTKGMVTTGSTAKTYYDAGVNAAITLWGLTVPATYLTTGAGAWDEAATNNVKMEKLMLQKYFALFFTDFQQWTEIRRTKHPELPIGPGVQNNGQMPSRFVYPIIVQSVNGANYKAAIESMGGPDDINTKVYWNQ